MWTFKQSTGEMFSSNGVLLDDSYSGAGADKDNPADEAIRDEGPIPRGRYTIGAPYTDPHKGVDVMRLTPDVTNNMFGRSGFLIHGDSIAHPGTASEGCIILPRAARQRIAESGDKFLEVIA